MAETPSGGPDAGPRAGIVLARLFVTVMVPVLLALASARLVMTEGYLYLEYSRPGFPADIYGFTLDDRLRYGPRAVDYLLNDEPIAFLGDLRFADGGPLFTGRELQHMADVKAVTRYAFLFAVLGGAAALAAGCWLWRHPPRQHHLRRALRDGATVTLAIIAAIVIVAVAAWDVFFTGFHNLLFAEGSWLFLYSDTLIRLFPEQFWFDSAIVVGLLTVMGAVAILLVGPVARKAGNAAKSRRLR